jgi:hypothetical protein
LSTLLCAIRKKDVRETPEEIIRQSLLEHLVKNAGFPSSLLAVETSLANLPITVPLRNKRRRVDIVCFMKTKGGAHPLLLIECKRKQPSIDDIAQVCGYNMYARCPLAAIAWTDSIAIYARSGRLYQGAFSSMPGYLALQEFFHL